MTELPDHLLAALQALPRRQDALLPALLLVQETLGYLPDAALLAVAAHLRLTPEQVEAATSAYPDLRREPVRGRVIGVCTGPACRALGGNRLLAALERELAGDVAGGRVTLQPVPCAFACTVAPVVEVDGVAHGRAKLHAVLARVRGPVGAERER